MFAKIGTVAKSWNAGIGRDFALVRIDPGWNVVSGVGGALGPTGTFCGDPLGQPVMHYGHGYIFFVEQGNAKFGEVIPDVSLIFRPSAEGFNWVGYGLPGDSGSGVMNVAPRRRRPDARARDRGCPGPRLELRHDDAAIFNLIGPGYSLVTVDGRRVNCAGVIGI